ncbi:retrovirus-related pol polyprotein from transposon TNT 1-94 [Tanacetum coccineum]
MNVTPPDAYSDGTLFRGVTYRAWVEFRNNLEPRWDSDTSEGSENSRSFEDSGRSDEEYSKDGASCKEGGSETSHVRRSTRESRALVRYSPSANYLLLTENGEPESSSEALSSKESIQLKKAIIEEMVLLEKNQMCSLVRLPVEKKASQSLWMFRGAGWQQKDLYLEQLDVKTAFLHGDLDEDIYMTQPEGVQSAGKEENLVYKLKKRYKRCAMDHCSDMAEFNKPKWLFPIVFEIKDRCSEKVLIFVEDSWNKEPCRDVHQVGDEREVEALRSLNLPPR